VRDGSASEAAWASYLERFHSERPGITEDLLRRCVADGRDPYRWCAEALPAGSGPVLDLACGSAPLEGLLPRWIGVDRCGAELQEARERERGPLVQAAADALPIATASADAAVCSMALQVLAAPETALCELARAVRPSGRIALLLPASGPLPVRDAIRYVAVQLALRQRIRYPNDAVLTPGRLQRMAGRAGLRVLDDERQAFRLPLLAPADAELVMRSLYLPGRGASRLRAGRRALEGALGRQLTIPLRRVVLERIGPPPTSDAA
jgi:SAM-dependent methyltransferase